MSPYDDSKISQSNQYGDNNVTIVIPQRDKLGATIDKIFEIISTNSPILVGPSSEIEAKIHHNSLSEKLRGVVQEVTVHAQNIEDICNQDGKWYSSASLIQHYKLLYQQKFQQDYNKKTITADDVFGGMVDYTLKEFQTRNIAAESHDSQVLPFLIAYAFINCGVLEKP